MSAGLNFGGVPGGFLNPNINAGLNFGGVPGGMMPGINFQAQYQQQQYAQYFQFQQQQMQAQMQAQQAWIQHWQSVQEERIQKQQVIGSLTQEMYKIQQQIQLVASGGIGSASILGASYASLNTGANLGTTLSTGPDHNPMPNTNTNTSGDLPVIENR